MQSESYVQMPVNYCFYIRTSQSPEPRLIFYYRKLKYGIVHQEACSQPWKTGFIRYMPSPYYPASVVLFQLHGGISDVVTASVYLEKTRQKKLTKIIIMNKLQETTFFHRRQKLTSAMKLWLEK